MIVEHPDDTVYLTDLKLNLAKMRAGDDYYVGTHFYNDTLFGNDDDLPSYQGISILRRFSLLKSFMSELHITMTKDDRFVVFHREYSANDLIELRTE